MLEKLLTQLMHSVLGTMNSGTGAGFFIGDGAGVGKVSKIDALGCQNQGFRVLALRVLVRALSELECRCDSHRGKCNLRQTAERAN